MRNVSGKRRLKYNSKQKKLQNFCKNYGHEHYYDYKRSGRNRFKTLSKTFKAKIKMFICIPF